MLGKIKSLLIYLATAVISFFFGLFILDQVILPHLTVGGELVEVPDLQGMSLEQARKSSDSEGLSLTVQGETYNQEYPADHVLKQEPEAGVVIKQGRQVYVILSLGPEIVTVPHVLGLTERQADILIERNRLEVEGVDFTADARMARGRVVAVVPPSGSALPRGSKVKLVLSEGVPKVRVPSIIDKDLEEAGNILREAGLELGEVSYRYNRYLTPGKVIDQQPLERTPVDKGTRVNLVLSSSSP